MRIKLAMTPKATKVYSKHQDMFDAELVAWQERGLLPLNRAVFKPSVTATLAKLIQQRFKLSPSLPKQGEAIEI